MSDHYPNDRKCPTGYVYDVTRDLCFKGAAYPRDRGWSWGWGGAPAGWMREQMRDVPHVAPIHAAPQHQAPIAIPNRQR